MDSKGGALPVMPAPLNPVSMKQPGEPLAGRRARGDLGGDPALLMDKAAAQLAATLQDSVLQKMATHSHAHERLKDLTSRVLNGDQEKLPKMCPPDPPILKGVDTPPPHGSPPRKVASPSPELKLKITQMVAKGKAARFEPCCAEGPNLAPEGLLGAANKSKNGRKRRTVKAKLPTKPRPCLVPTMVCLRPLPREMSNAAAKVSPGQKAEVQVVFSVGDVVWTKVAGSPWWPCMVTIDPELNKHFKHKQKVNCRTVLLYHVQYFGDNPERGYMLERSMVSFRGEEQYQQLCQSNKLPTAAAFQKQPLVPRKLRVQWSQAVGQAQRAAGLPPEERLALFSFIYEADGPRLNPWVLAGLPPSPACPEMAPPAVPSPAAPITHPKHSTSAGKRTPCPKNTEATATRGRRKLTASPLPKKAKASNSSKEVPQTQSLFQDPSATTDAQLLESQKKLKKSKLPPQPRIRKVGKQSKLLFCAASVPGANASPKKKPQLSPKDPETDPKGKLGKKPPKRAREPSADEPPRKRHRGVSEKVKVPDNSATAKQKNTKKVKKEIGKKGTNKISLPAEDTLSEKPNQMRKKRQETGLHAATQPKRRRSSAVPDLEGSGSEGRPDSPSDSIDGTKKHTGPKKEITCQVCELSGEDVFPCEGLCCGSFHLLCLGLALQTTNPPLQTSSPALHTSSPALHTSSPAPGKLLCSQCSSGLHVCFSCKQWEGVVRRCSVLNCGKFYHEACARLDALSVFDNKGFRCPLHTCRSCHYACRAKPRASKGRMMRCLRCPVAYHIGDLCVAAGSQVLNPNAIICTNHFSPKKDYKHHSHVNVSWCFVCSKGGRLLCCESCPAAFHPDCLNIAMPDGSWFCNDCRAGKKPKYRDIIWVKLGNYRWWPAEIRHPRSVPTNIQHLRHQIGEFPVFFFGSRDYFWTHQGRVFPYVEGDRSNKHQKTGIGKVFKNALLEAETRFKEMKVEREAKEAQENNRKPPPYKYIKVNKPFGKVQVYTADVSEIPKCNCKPSDDKPCGFESECLNRMLMYECHPQVCPSAERCCNQDFTKRLYPETKIIKTAGKGWGLVSLRDIRKGEFVNEYVGELIDEEECRARIRHAQENDITHFYMLTIYKDRIIDAGPKGNYSRFMNHSCQPNCETQKWTVNGDTRVGLFAVCDIPAGTELTFNYNLDCLGNEKTVCRCGAPNCSGFLGDRPKSGQAEPKGGKSVKKKVKRRRTKNDGRKQSEDECFRCGDGGQLVLCDKKSCTKAYHLSCLDRTKRPFGRWDCPWHHCDVCGKNSEAFCQLCPNSFCRAHEEGALRPWVPTGQLCCLEHEDPGPPRDLQV